MNIQETAVTIKFDHSEIYMLGNIIFCYLKIQCESHWIKHPEKFEHDERENLEMMKKFFECSGYGALHIQHLETLRKIISNKH